MEQRSDNAGSSLGRSVFAKFLTDLTHGFAHLSTQDRISEDTKGFVSNPLGMDILLNQFWGNLFLCQQIDESNVVHSNQSPADPIGEERELLENLKGYKEYVTKTKYRLVPGIW
jgi:hypothetical protein